MLQAVHGDYVCSSLDLFQIIRGWSTQTFDPRRVLTPPLRRRRPPPAADIICLSNCDNEHDRQRIYHRGE
jgi:hypothetical protein